MDNEKRKSVFAELAKHELSQDCMAEMRSSKTLHSNLDVLIARKKLKTEKYEEKKANDEQIANNENVNFS